MQCLGWANQNVIAKLPTTGASSLRSREEPSRERQIRIDFFFQT